MSTKHTGVEKTDAPTRVHAGYLGRDTEGYDHVILRDQRRVVRLDETGVERTVDLGEHDDIEYREWVENQIGWATRNTLIPVALAGALGGSR